MNKKKGILFILLAGLGFALMGLFVSFAGDIPTMQKAFFRNLIPILVSGFMIKKNSEDVSLKKGDLKFLVLRAIFGTLGIICNFYAIDHMHLSDANMLNKLSPFFMIIFSAIILGEKINIIQMIAVIIAFIGALFIIKPTGNISMFPAIVGTMGGASAAMAYTFVRLLGKRNVNGHMIVLFFSSFSCLTSVPFMIFNYQKMTLYQTIMLILAGAFATVGQLSITKAYFYAPSKEISIYDYSQIIISALLGFLFLNQVPDKFSFLGYSIIFLMGFWMYFYNKNKD